MLNWQSNSLSIRISLPAFIDRSSCCEYVPCQVILVLFCPILRKCWAFSKLQTEAAALVWHLSNYHAVCLVLMHLASCRHHVCICWFLFDLSYELSTTGHVREFPIRVPQVHSVTVQWTLCPFLFLVHIGFVRYTSILNTLVDCSLSSTCPVHMLS